MEEFLEKNNRFLQIESAKTRQRRFKSDKMLSNNVMKREINNKECQIVGMNLSLGISRCIIRRLPQVSRKIKKTRISNQSKDRQLEESLIGRRKGIFRC